MKKLNFGDTIGIVAPSNKVDIKKIETAKANLEELGFKVILGESTKSNWYSFAGTDEIRSKDINKFFADKSISAIMCMRGGFGGCARILDKIDYDIIRKNPKIFIGFSDITSLHAAFFTKCNLTTFYGPMAASNFSDNYNKNTFNYMKEILIDNVKIIPNIKDINIIKNGISSGKVIGGNLCTLITTIGTDFEYDYKGKILFLEEIEEKTIRIDRMFRQLKNIGVFDKISGVILGDFTGCDKMSETDMTLNEVFEQYFVNVNYPVISNLNAGHCEPTLTIPFGTEIKIDTRNKKISIIKDIFI